MRLGLSFVLVTALAACGDSGSGGDDDGDGPEDTGFDCEALDFSPCGGDVVGVWSFVALCDADEPVEDHSEPVSDDPACEESLLVVATSTSGSQTFTAEGTYSSTSSLAAEAEVNIDADCAAALAPDATLADFCDAWEDLTLSDPDNQFDNMQCAVSSGQCRCQGDFTRSLDDSGTFTAGDGTLTTFSDGGSDRQDDYCIAEGLFVIDEQDSSDFSHTYMVYE